MPKILFGDDSDDDVLQPNEPKKEQLSVNESYASNYDKFRREEELGKLRDKYGDDFNSESSSSSEDDFAEPDNPDFDGEFFKVMSALKSQNPGIPEKKFFTQSYAIPTKKEDKEKPMTIRDMERKRLIESGGHFEESDEELKGFSKSVGEDMKSKHRREAKGRKSMANVVGFADDGIGGSGDEDDNLLTKVTSDTTKKLKKKKKKKPRDEVVDWKTKDKSEQWLKNFFVTKRYLDSDDDELEGDELDHFVDEETISEDEATFDKMEDFASQYNFRYLEPDGHTIRSYPREIKGSLREKSTKRKDQREAAAAKKLENKETRGHEITVYKMLRQKEILDKIELLKEISGNENIDGLVKELKEDFDCEQHDVAMKSMFSADYYDGKEDGDQKPVFPDDEDVYNDYDDWMEKSAKAKKKKEELKHANRGIEDFPDPDENVDVDGSALTEPSTSEENKTKLAQILSKEKRPFDPSIESFDSYYDEYYKLEFEDIVGGMPVRFNYKPVGANSFGLTTQEILSCKDKELNKWYSINKLLRYDRNKRDEMDDATNYSKRSEMTHIKYKFLPSLFSEAPEEELQAQMEKTRIKNHDKRERKQQRKQALIDGIVIGGNIDDKLQNNGTDNFDGVESTKDTVEGGGKKRRDPKVFREAGDGSKKRKHVEKTVSNLSKWEKKMRSEKYKSNTFLDDISDDRLIAMGAIPKKVRSSMKYKDKNKDNPKPNQ